MRKASQPGEPEDIPMEWCERRQRSGQSVARLSSRQMAAILSDIIMNETQINYFARKVDVLIFLLGHIVLVTEVMARLGTSWVP